MQRYVQKQPKNASILAYQATHENNSLLLFPVHTWKLTHKCFGHSCVQS